MEITQVILPLATLLAGILITWLIMRSASVSRKAYDSTRDELAKTRSNLEIKVALEQELRQQMDSTRRELSDEKIKNQSQEKQIAELQAHAHNVRERLDEEKAENTKQQGQIEENNKQILELRSALSHLKTINDSLKEKVDQKTEEFEAQRKKSLTEFENIANKLFEEKSDKFSKTSKENIEQMLNPLKENIAAFKKQVEETYDKESKQRFSLEREIKNLAELNNKISQDATNLTNALKGQAKTQGDWGEMVLESILENSGLVKDRHYFKQNSFTDKEGNRKQPDILIKYPGSRHIIIDSKVSLVAYEKFANATERDQQELHLAAHISSIKNHISGLSSKEYDELEEAPNFVMLFIPIEGAYITAMQQDPELWNYAYRKRVLLINPTNLIAALNLVQDVWQREQQNNNARLIAQRGEALYEKFVGFVSDMENIDKHLSKAGEAYTDAMKKLSSGRGNLIGQVEKLKKLGVQSKKEIDERYLVDNPELEAGENSL